ncbi:GNAT family N-acetyltransferase [Pyxidicoccus sp. 3LG]
MRDVRAMTWSVEEKRDACLRAPMGGDLVRTDTRIIARPGWYQVVTPSAPGSVLNEVVLSQVDVAEAEQVIDETIAVYRETGHPTKWCVGFWTRPEDFGERLTRRGFSSWDVRGMGCDTTTVHTAPRRVTVDEVTEPDLDSYVSVEQQGWSLPASDAEVQRGVYLSALRAHPRRVHLFVARLGGEVVGTAGLVLRDGYAYLLGAQVLEAARGQGAYRALVTARLEFLRECGIGYAVTQAREATSAPILEHLGFETLFRSRCYRLP